MALVPAYNEAKKIADVVRSLRGHVDEVVVIDDASTDTTNQLARAAGATVLTHRLNRGQGAALETGQVYARERGADFVLHFDGDGQFDVADIAPALEKLKKSNADILLGSRFLDLRSELPWFKRYLVLPIGRLVDRSFGRLNLTDVHNGFRILNIRALKHITITHDRMAHASEIPALISKNNLKWVEFPVRVSYSEYGQGAGEGVKIVRDLFVGWFVK